ncbi:MAG TPA: cold shock domain-containing protein [Clostridia bacterium]|nr:cold shock domain-containing protein [Clostridia bacterium]
MREKGTIKTYFDDRGFGFIRRVGCPDVFFHCSQVGTEGDRQITVGALVEFEIVQADKGLRAVMVTLL